MQSHVPIPPCRDPFINTPLLALGPDAAGVERFWISTWNSVTGCIGALVDEHGGHRLYRFYEPKHPGFYSAAMEDADTLWLWGDLSRVVRLSLASGAYESFPTGAPAALVFHGMAFDPDTGKLLAAAYPQTPAGVTAVSFDTRTRTTAKIHVGVAPDYYQHGVFRNADGTYSLVLECPGTSIIRWDPRTEQLQPCRLRESFDLLAGLAEGSLYRLIQDERGRAYLPHLGWFDPICQQIEPDGPRPAKEMTWFARRGDLAYGVCYKDGNATLGTWDLASGKVTDSGQIPDCTVTNVNLTQGGKIVCVNVFGEFVRLDGATGRLECSRWLPATSIQHTDCLRRIDGKRLLGTPFITQRFWEVDIETGKGYDCGRAAPGVGEILQTWNLNGRLYMAEYGGGRLVEYDPAEHPHFPENPRLVANPPGSMRPIAAAQDGRNLYYSCSAHYGHLGSTVTRYDTETGASVSAVNPVPDQRIVSLHYEAGTESLLAGTSYDADCKAGTPTSQTCYLARLAAADLRALEQIEAPPGTMAAFVRGPLRPGRWLCHCIGQIARDGTPLSNPLIELASSPALRLDLATAWAPPAGWRAVEYAGRPGLFVVHAGEQIELWDLRQRRALEVLYQGATAYRLQVDLDLFLAGKAPQPTLHLIGEREIVVVDYGVPASGMA
jgi:hypothetical protein